MTKTFAIMAFISTAIHGLIFAYTDSFNHIPITNSEGIVEIALVSKGSKTPSISDSAEKNLAQPTKPLTTAEAEKKITKKQELPLNKPKQPVNKQKTLKNSATVAKIATSAEKTATNTVEKTTDSPHNDHNQSMLDTSPKTGTDVLGKGDSQTPAKAHKIPKPKYPRASRIKGEEGTVTLQITVTDKGIAEKAEIISSSGYPKLDKEALAVIPTASFIPAEKNGVAVKSVMTLKIRFTLEDVN